MNPRCGPPIPMGTPKLWASPQTMSAPSSPGGRSRARERASVTATTPPPNGTSETLTTSDGSVFFSTIGGEPIEPSASNFTVVVNAECYVQETLQAPVPSEVVVPRLVTPRKTSTVTLGSAVPVMIRVLSLVTPSPAVPVSSTRTA